MLAAGGLLTATRTPGASNRRQLQLTDEGARLVERCAEMLEDRFADLVDRSSVPYSTYQRYTRRLLSQLDSDQHGVAARAGAA